MAAPFTGTMGLTQCDERIKWIENCNPPTWAYPNPLPITVLIDDGPNPGEIDYLALNREFGLS